MDVLGKLNGPMSEAQKRLYKKLMKSLDTDSASDELSKRSEQSFTPAELYERKLALERKSSDVLRERASRALEKKTKKDASASRLRSERMKRVEFEARRKKKEVEEGRLREIELKTHKFFRLNSYGRAVETGVVYFGETLWNSDAWVAHGFGEYRVNGEVIYEGDFNKGQMHGKGIYMFSNHDTWKGTFRFDQLHGIGLYQKHEPEGEDDPPTRECFYFKNRRAGWIDEMLPGVHITWLEETAFHSKGATLLKRDDSSKRKNGHFTLKLDGGGIEDVDLTEFGFSVDLKAARVTLLEEYVPRAGVKGATRDGTHDEKRFDYSLPALNTERKENWYSDRAEPTNASAEEDKAKARKKKEWEERQKAKAAEADAEDKRKDIDAARKEKKEREDAERREKEDAAVELEKSKQELLEQRKKNEQMVKNAK